jgi:hypothetical protein
LNALYERTGCKFGYIWDGCRVKKYGILEEILRKEFGTVWIFSKESGIPRSTLSMLINGKYGSDEKDTQKRIEEKLKNLRIGIDLSHIWDPTYAWYQKYVEDKAIVKNGFRITVDVKLNDEGQLTIAPFVEGY